MRRTAAGLVVSRPVCQGARDGNPEWQAELISIKGHTGILRVAAVYPGKAQFSVQRGRWIGAKVGHFSVCPSVRETAGDARLDYFRRTPFKGEE
ncbi:MAG: hypothetical protein JEZ10_06595 [Verrucomicrobia bacterium]|nr:hypothetical protein [Verrucomicrobiota bacterium]